MIFNSYSEKDYYEIQKAILYLNQSFANVKDVLKPELLHSLHTGFSLIDYGYPVKIVITGFLHDIIEEGEEREDIKKLFGEKVYKIVSVNSKSKSLTDWYSQCDELVARIASYGEDAMVVKVADVLDNFVYIFEIDDALGKERMIHMVKQIFKYTNSTDKIFGELRQVFKRWNNKN